MPLLMPTAAKAVIAKMDKSITDARIVAANALRKVQDTETKKGNLDGALAIKKKIEELLAQVDDGRDLLGEPTDPMALIVGTWHVTRPDGCNSMWVFNKDKTVVGPGYAGVYQVKDNAIFITWNGDPNSWDLFKLPITDSIVGDGHGVPAGTVKGERVKK